MDFIKILSSKSHNKHYLNRYVKFIKYCSNLNFEGYTENHHICPKSKDLFPEFKNFKNHSWNKCKLTARQHFIAHWILSKVYPIKSTNSAFWLMCHDNNKNRYSNLNSKSYELLKIARSAFVSDQMKYNNPSTFPKVKEKRKLALIKNTYGEKNKGQKRTEDQKLNMSKAQKGHSNSSENHKNSVTKANNNRKGTFPTKAAVEKRKVKCYCEGIIYDSITEAQDAYKGISINKRLNNPKYPNFYKLKKELI